MLYDPERTKDVVNRLVVLGNTLRTPVLVSSAVFFSAVMGIFGGIVLWSFWGVIFAVFGLIVGLAVGVYAASALSAVLEWMAQVLVAIQPDRPQAPRDR